MINLVKHIKSELSAFYDPREAESFLSIILYETLGITTQKRLMGGALELSEEKLSEINAVIERLKRHEPIQYIFGKTEFYGLDFTLTTDVLIPRPETEELVEWIIQSVGNEPLKILDIGTGSGCIAVSLAKNLPLAELSAVDVSPEALAVAEENARRSGVSVRFLQENILEVDSLGGTFDVIASNPPYVLDSEREDMERNVLDYEPCLALFVPDSDPLRFYRKIGELAFQSLQEGGLLFFEINSRFGSETKAMLQEIGFQDILVKKDISERDRFVKCIKKSS